MSTLLDTINDPNDLKVLPREQLPQLAQELREYMVETVSKTGGHLAPSLGVVELSIALHYVFNTPDEKIIWDVGHQSYAHKILTGRREAMKTLRQYEGLSGFCKRSESAYDAFGVGHASTSISAAIGIAEAYHRIGKGHNKTIAVIGDGSMTGGLAFEGLNHAGHGDRNILVILNDNEMSISPNVGALSSFISRKLTSHFFVKARKEIKQFLLSLPGVGSSVVHAIQKAEDSVKSLLTPGIIFEGLGFQYIGPIDGHHMETLVTTLSNIREITRPVLLHVVTKKGKGYEPAENDPVKFHGIGPFNKETGQVEKKYGPPQYTKVFSDTIVDLARSNDRILAITAAMTSGTGLDEFASEFPDRFFDVGIAESHGMIFAGCLAMEGFVPVYALYSTFAQRAFDQLVHDICLQNLPVVICMDRAGIVGDDGPTHNGTFDLSYLRMIPNIVIMAPKDENELRHMLYSAVEWRKGPVVIRYPRGDGYGVSLDTVYKKIEIGKSEILEDPDHSDILIVGIGSTVVPCRQASELLKRQGIRTTVVNARFAKPLDVNLLTDLAKKIGCVLTVEENVLHGGFGSGILEMLTEAGLYDIPVKRIGIPDEFVEHGAQSIMRCNYNLHPEGIAKIASNLVRGVKSHVKPVEVSSFK